MRPIALVALLGIGCGGAAGGGGASDDNIRHNLETLNVYRAQAGAPPLELDERLSSFAATGSEQLAAGGDAHGHFKAAMSGGTLWSSGFCHSAAENQAPGWSASDVSATIDAILASMMAEGPGGGHHDNIVNPALRRVGVGLVV